MTQLRDHRTLHQYMQYSKRRWKELRKCIGRRRSLRCNSNIWIINLKHTKKGLQLTFSWFFGLRRVISFRTGSRSTSFCNASTDDSVSDTHAKKLSIDLSKLYNELMAELIKSPRLLILKAYKCYNIRNIIQCNASDTLRLLSNGSEKTSASICGRKTRKD